MQFIEKIVALLKPFKELIAITVFLVGGAYGAITYFATARQLADARDALEKQQQARHTEAIGALRELRCLTELNRRFLRAEIDEFRVSTLLDKNLFKTGSLENEQSAFARQELAALEVNRNSLAAKLHDIGVEKGAALQDLSNSSCSPAG